MPEVFPKRILSFTSEDSAFPASNLLKSSSFSKWRSEKGGSKQEIVELDFGEPIEVARLDIGNNGSAFIEVLVRRSVSDDDPTIFLPSSSFMSPVESKNENNLFRVRVFSGEQLNKAAASQKWDIFRFVCSQPFNKTLQYGISFVSFHSPHPKSEPPAPAKPSLVSSDDVENGGSLDILPGSLFHALKSTSETGITEPSSVAEKLRVAEQSNFSATAVSSSQHPRSPRNLQALVKFPGRYASNKDATDSAKKTVSTAIAMTSPHPHSPKSSAVHESPKHAVDYSTTNRPRKNARSKTKASDVQPEAGSSSSPLSGVVFTLSGYQNPLRSELRKKALQLGAIYKQDWGSSCTHLICAFPNTPKYKAVWGKGIIVSDKWITKCHDTKTKVDWHPYRVGRAPSPPSEKTSIKSDETPVRSADQQSSSEDEDEAPEPIKRNDDEDWELESEEDDADDEEDEGRVQEEGEEGEGEEAGSDSGGKKKAGTRKAAAKKRKSQSSCTQTTSKKKKSASSEDEAKDTKWSAVRRKNAGSSSNVVENDPEDEDTDEEIERVMNQSDDKRESNAIGDKEPSGPIPDLPDIFNGRHFFIYSKAIPVDEERLLQRLIVAFSGSLHQYMSPDVQLVITRSKWNEEFDHALKENSKLTFVRPDWIFECDEKGQWVPYQKFLVVG
ncbi:unnamed protein product [Calicophoron daubneyi]|uniref:BRCT domain-containing protein n=1 Tax=Calicophoron daubneyi TaxID=300641 RepID=A0AAV2T9K1_CALDB